MIRMQVPSCQPGHGKTACTILKWTCLGLKPQAEWLQACPNCGNFSYHWLGLGKVYRKTWFLSTNTVDPSILGS